MKAPACPGTKMFNMILVSNMLNVCQSLIFGVRLHRSLHLVATYNIIPAFMDIPVRSERNSLGDFMGLVWFPIIFHSNPGSERW